METMTQETPQSASAMPAAPQAEHDWLQQLVGEWTYETEMSSGADQSAEKASGTETVRSLNGLWVIAEAAGEMPGCGKVTMLITLGYDPRKQRYIGTWVGSMMPNLWLYDGELDADQTLTLISEGPSMMDDQKMAQYKDAIAFQSPDQRTMTSSVLGEDGQWHPFMMVTYRRKS
jgi:hypothetical protein